ncbi:Endoglucanase-7 [Dactylella cylindrospora]|nr:Endoglucanase-7 [Dactylella cylindrospora]
MQLTSALLILSAGLASAHYTFPGLIFNGQTSADWTYVKMTTNKYSHGPITDVNSNDMRCYKDPAAPVASTANVAAGATVGFRVDTSISHPGPLMFYLAKVPSGKTAANFEGEGTVWFKIWENYPTITSSSISWPSGQTTVSVQIPSCIPAGQYLLRVEHIALHSAGSSGGAQIYIACGQINVTGGGSKAGSPLVAFPGAYRASDPGLLINIYWPIPTSYKNPGPAVFKC